MAAVTADASRVADHGLRWSGPGADQRPGGCGPVPGGGPAGPGCAVLAAPAAAEVWSGWAVIAQKTGFGRVSPLPGI